MLAEIAETEAAGEIAAIFAEVRELWGVPYVSAIQRHLATRPGVLEWAWEAVGPAFRSGAAQTAAVRAAADIALAPLAPISRDVLSVWGVDEAGVATIRGTADGFVRVAPINMMFAGLVKALLSGAVPGSGDERPAATWSRPTPLPSPPAMVVIEALPDAQRSVMLRFGTPSNGVAFVPGLYRMLAHWPAFVAHLATVLPPRLAAAETLRAFDDIRARIDAAVPGVLATLPPKPTLRPPPSESERAHFMTIGATYRKTSPELIVSGRLIRAALPV